MKLENICLVIQERGNLLITLLLVMKNRFIKKQKNHKKVISLVEEEVEVSLVIKIIRH